MDDPAVRGRYGRGVYLANARKKRTLFKLPFFFKRSRSLFNSCRALYKYTGRVYLASTRSRVPNNLFGSDLGIGNNGRNPPPIEQVR